jgi:hypothetical protein
VSNGEDYAYDTNFTYKNDRGIFFGINAPEILNILKVWLGDKNGYDKDRVYGERSRAENNATEDHASCKNNYSGLSPVNEDL